MVKASEAERARWARWPLTVQAILILALAVGPVLISIAMLAFNSERDRTLDREIVEHRSVRESQAEIFKELVDAEGAVRGFLMTGDRSFLGPFLQARSNVPLIVPFARLGAEATEIEGSGLGLALSRRLTELMGGDMDIGASGPDGSEFWLELRSAEAIPDRIPAPVRPGELGGSRAAGDDPHKTVLQVEDNPINIRLVERIVARRPNGNLVTVQHGAQAVQMAKSVQPALVLLDLNLPDISGRDVLAHLRAEPDTAGIPVIMVSADASPKQIERLLASGASAYLTKPLDVGHFLTVIDGFLEGKGVA